MYRLPDKDLPKSAQTHLQKKQKEINELSDYAEQVRAGKALWDKKTNTNAGKKAFKQIRTTLRTMHGNLVRCGYCEDSAADEIEHIKPKNFYPGKAFVWLNYLYACGPCNGRKRDYYAVFPKDKDKPEHLKRGRKDPVLPPPDGEPAFLDRRKEDPMDYMILDIWDTFAFRPKKSAGARAVEKARFTIDTLGLNKRPELPEARKNAYHQYLACLESMASKKEKGEDFSGMAETIRKSPHRTVWLFMKNYQNRLPELQTLFEKAPEALQL